MLFAVLFGLLVLFDCQNVLAWRRKHVVELGAESTDDFTIVVPLYNDPRYFENAAFLRPMRERVILAVDVGAPVMADWADTMERDGWRVHRVVLPDRRQNGPTPIVRVVLESGAVRTRWVVRLDGDTYAGGDFGQAVAAAERAGADFCSVKCLPSGRSNALERIQVLEYEMAMLNRHLRPWASSGACIVATEHAYRAILKLHTLTLGTCGEDMETGRIALHLRMRIRHLDFRVYTSVPGSVGAWWCQRRIWWAAIVQSSIVNADKTLVQLPLYWIYFALLAMVGAFAKWDALAADWRLLPTILLLYTGLILVANWQVRSRWMIVYPYYAFAQATVMPLFGLQWYVANVSRRGISGRYRFGLLPGRYTPQAAADAVVAGG